LAIAAVAPGPPVAIVAAVLFGVGAGSFLSVDWALMTEIIPRASSGRYMGISNVATATNGVAAVFLGGLIIDAFSRAGVPELGPRAVFLLAPFCFAIGALLLRPVIEPGRVR
jgi:MFS family permease